MANLRTNNLCGDGGRNAYDGSVFFEGDSSYLSLASGVVPSFGTGDFTIEFWINQGVNASNYTVLFALTSSTASDRLEVAIHSSTIQVYTDTGAWRDTGYAPVSGVYEHIVFQRDSSGDTLKMYANGVEKWSVSNTRDYDEAWTTQIGSYGSSSYGYFEGYISNFRICKGHLVYSSNNFAPPTSELTVHYNSDGDETVLLCCQDSDDATQEATGKTITGFGRYADSSVELVPNGGPTTDVTGWTAYNSSVAYDTGQIKVTRSGGTGFSAYATITNAVIGQRYTLSGQIRSASSRADLYVTTAVASGSLIVLYGTASATVDVSGEFTATATTLYVFTAIDGDGDIGYYNRVSVKAADYGDAPKVIPPFGVDAGNTFNGAISMNSQGYMYFPTGRREERGRGRAVSWLGVDSPNYTKQLDFFDIQSQGTTTKFGEISDTVGLGAGMSSSTRGVFAGGTKPGVGNMNLLEFITIATTGNAVDFGGVSTLFRYGAGISNQTRGLICGAYQGGGASGTLNTIQYITIATLGDTADFGDMLANSAGGITGAGSCQSSTRGITFGGAGYQPSQVDEIHSIEIGTLGNSVNFGDLSATKYYCQGVSSSTRGVVAGGYQDSPGFTSTNVIEYITIASTGDALDFGDLITSARLPGSSGGSNKIRGVFVGAGVHPSYYNTMEFITIATTGNTTDFGDISTSGGTPYGSVAVSDSHGGLS